MDNVSDFIASIENEAKQADVIELLNILEKVSGYNAFIKSGIIGFGHYHYQYDSGHEGNAAIIGFALRTKRLVVYIMPGFDKYEMLLTKLGKYKLGKSCLYINQLSDVKIDVFIELASLSVKYMQENYSCSDS